MAGIIELNIWYDEIAHYCPAQCYYYFKEDNVAYCIYLRWRHKDPWSVTLIRFFGDYQTDLDFICASWTSINLKKDYGIDDDLEELKKESIEVVKKIVKK